MVYNEVLRCRTIDEAAGGLHLYQPLIQYALPSHLPFLVSPDPFVLSVDHATQLAELGPALAEFFQAVALQRNESLRYVFFRPDIVFTQAGLRVCEVETSPFGLALSLFLQSQYIGASMLGSVSATIQAFAQDWQEWFGTNKGRFVYTQHSKQYRGQLEYLASVLNEAGLKFSVQDVREAAQDVSTMPIYRCFYPHERASDPAVAELCHAHADRMIPQGAGLYEGKKMLALWHSGMLREHVSVQTASVLDRCLLRTWIIGFDPPSNFPVALKRWEDLALLGKTQRMYVIKRAGDHPDASWSRSVVFLHKRFRAEVTQVIRQALYEPGEWVIQEFISNEKYTLRHADAQFESLHELKGRVRLTPYFSARTGQLLTAKATLREGTLFVHAASDSINTAVSI